jgi:HSP20 family protein
LTPLREAMSRLFEESFIGPRRIEGFGRTIPVDIRETQDSYIVEASLPGIKPEELEITAQENLLTIHATRKREEEKKEGRYVRRERYEGEITRTIALPANIDSSKVTATYEGGVLTLQMPKADTSKARQIRVQTKG